MSAVDPRTLELIGKNAASLAESGGVGMSDAVVTAIGAAKLNEQQVRRVVEFANIEIFNKKFSSMQGTVRSVHIEGGPANPVDVIQKLNNAARPREVPMNPSDYSIAPDFSKSSSAEDSGNVAEVGMEDILDLRNKLAHARDHFIASRDAAEQRSMSLIDPLLESIKSASAAGAHPSEVFEAMVVVNKAAAEILFPQVSHLISSSNEKIASRYISSDSRLVQNFSSFAKAASEATLHSRALEEVLSEISRVDTWIKEASKALAAGESIAHAAKSLYSGAKAVAHGASDVGAGVAKGLGTHENVGRAAGLAALGAGGYVGARKVKNKADEIKFKMMYGDQGMYY